MAEQITFIFIGTFTYVNFELSRAPISLSPMYLGFVYLVFLPAMVTTPLAGYASRRWGNRTTVRSSFALCFLALPMLISASLNWVLAGLTLIGVGTFFAQAAATGFVGQAAASDRAAASGLYLASYYLGGLVGAAVLGQVYDRYGWSPTVLAIGVAVGISMVLCTRLVPAEVRS